MHCVKTSCLLMSNWVFRQVTALWCKIEASTTSACWRVAVPCTRTWIASLLCSSWRVSLQPMDCPLHAFTHVHWTMSKHCTNRIEGIHKYIYPHRYANARGLRGAQVQDAGTQQGLNTGTLFSRSLRIPPIWSYQSARLCPRATYPTTTSTLVPREQLPPDIPRFVRGPSPC
jgi:hypothetical protein